MKEATSAEIDQRIENTDEACALVLKLISLGYDNLFEDIVLKAAKETRERPEQFDQFNMDPLGELLIYWPDSQNWSV